jgi:peptide/nickel transport system substrate-binding protein
MNPDNTPITRAGYDKIESIDTLDDYTVTINFSEPYPSWKILFDFVLPKHVIEENSPGLDESQAMREPIGFGPYKIVQWKTGEFIEYEAFEDYWQGAPAIDRFFIVIYPSTEALLAALEAGEVDIAWGLRPANVPAIQALEPDVSLVTAPVPGQERYVMNGDASLAPLFANRELRVALQQAVDKQTIIDNILHGYAEPAISSWSGSPWENPDLVPHEFDPEKSREILEELGWRDEDGDGIREAHGVEGLEDGTPLSFKHATTSGVLQREQVQLLVQQMFKDVGVDMVIENRRTAELFGTWDQGGVWSHGEYEMGGWSHGLRLPDPDISIRFLCSEIASEENPTGAQWHHYCNPEVDELLQAFQTEVDETKRIDLLYQAQAIMHDDAYNIYLFMSPQIYAVNSALNNFELTPFTRWYGNIHNWEWQ